MEKLSRMEKYKELRMEIDSDAAAAVHQFRRTAETAAQPE